MAYRPTARTRANAQQRRLSIESAARHVIARGGFAAASVAAVAREAECSTGLIYTYYANRDELLRAVFARASGHELAVIETAVAQASTAAAIAESVAEVFVRRAVTGRRLAHALLFEEVPDAVQLERLILRRGYVASVAAGLDRASGHSHPVRAGAESPSAAGGAARDVSTVPAEVAARFIVGGIAENLVDVLDPTTPPPRPDEIEALISALSAFTRSALGSDPLGEK
ncbi:TetR family transcriptional regulator [Brevibacterium renqingii]|uniref:TetR family transcriptional regulator n=1 Tax=Brevibacterium renqingii TaxID=2776916 RepID=UPI001AE0AE14|nr:TetR family transcriptional regulator [Brevibacterium renqingii]